MMLRSVLITSAQFEEAQASRIEEELRLTQAQAELNCDAEPNP